MHAIYAISQLSSVSMWYVQTTLAKIEKMRIVQAPIDLGFKFFFDLISRYHGDGINYPMVKAIDETNMLHTKPTPGTATAHIYQHITIQTIDMTCTKKDVSVLSPPISSWY